MKEKIESSYTSPMGGHPSPSGGAATNGGALNSAQTGGIIQPAHYQPLSGGAAQVDGAMSNIIAPFPGTSPSGGSAQAPTSTESSYKSPFTCNVKK